MFCKRKGIKLYLSNNIQLAIKLGFDGAYIPAFNKSLRHLNYKIKKNFKIDAPEFLNKLGNKVKIFPIYEKWVDIGTHEELRKIRK